MPPHDHQAAVQVDGVYAAESRGICSLFDGWLIFHLSDLCFLDLGIWDHTVEGIFLQVAVAEAQ